MTRFFSFAIPIHWALRSFFWGITCTLIAPFATVAAVHYVDAGSTNTAAPYSSWTTAARTIQDAIDVAEVGDEIVVTNGVYQAGGRVVYGSMTNRVAVTNPLTVRSVNGPEVTVIRGFQVPGTKIGDGAVRCAYLTNGATLIGFTLTDGATRASGDVRMSSGGGVWCESTNAIVSNCTLAGNLAGSSGGGGAYLGTLQSCTVSGNSALYEGDGGGAFASTLNRCVVTGNSAYSGGGVFHGNLNNCVLTRNSSYGDRDGSWGGAAFDCVMNNCTLVDNSARYGSGALYGKLNNCIVYYDATYGSVLNYCCTTSLPPTGQGNITNTPIFIDRAGGNLRLQPNSPCINAGINVYAPDGPDLDGQPRIVGGTVDIGAYEFNPEALYVSDAHVTERNTGTTNALFVVNLAVSHPDVVSVDFTTTDGSATAGNDYVATNATLIFAPGETSKLIAVPVLGDVLDEANETFFIQLSNPTNLSLVRTQATGTIMDDDTVPLSIAGVTVLEGNAGMTNAVFTLQLDRPHVLPVQVDFATQDGSAAEGADYVATNGVATFSPGETNKSIIVLVSGDLLNENDETFSILLSNPIHAALTNNRASGTILDDDMGIFYVNVNNPSPLPPYTNWSTAAATIQDAIEVALASDEIVVASGTYQTGGRAVYGTMTNRVAVTKRVTVRSLSGPAATIIRGYQLPVTKYGDGAVRCAYVTNGAVLKGFTLTGGATRASGDAREINGGGVWCASGGGVVSDCTIVGNSAYDSGGGVVAGTLNNCTLRGNSANGSMGEGGGAFGSTLNNCVLTGNLAGSANGYGGGAAQSALNNCTLTSNLGRIDGGGAFYCTLNNCIVTGNSARYGAGAAGGTLNNCTVVGNSVDDSGSGGFGGGTYNATLNNCIVYYNTATNGANHIYGTLKHCCTMPQFDPQLGNFTNAPLFVNRATGNLQLQSNSPCINAGRNGYAPVGPDLDGLPRIVGGTVDIGSYEFQFPQSTISYAWLQQYGLPLDGSADVADSDGDRMNNFEEWHAGTNPGDPTSLLRLMPPILTGSNVVVAWASVAGRSYSVIGSTNRGYPSFFFPVATGIPGKETTTTHTHTNAARLGFSLYRVIVE